MKQTGVVLVIDGPEFKRIKRVFLYLLNINTFHNMAVTLSLTKM